MDLEEIELNCNFDFEREIKKKYGNIIIDIFNNSCPDKYINNNIDIDMMIIIALYYIYNKDYDNAIEILIEAINNNQNNFTWVKASCTLGVLYNILDDKIKSIKYFKLGADEGHILSSTNLAFEYLCQGEFDLFFKYNKIGLDNQTEGSDENALINEGIYLWNVLKKHKDASNIFDKLIDTNYRACFEYAKLVNNLYIKKELLMKAIKLKPKKTYIDMLKRLTCDFERYELYKNYNIKQDTLKNYDNFEFNIKFNITRYSRCPICINNEKVELFTLKCDHSFCSSCIKKYCNKKCALC